MSPSNGQLNKTGIQVEIHFSKYRKKIESDEVIANQVMDELVEMGLLQNKFMIDSYFTRWMQYGNVIFDTAYSDNLDLILRELEQYGLIREPDDLEPITNWKEKLNIEQEFGEFILAGRYGQWKYYWTDDCILRGKYIKDNI